MHISVGILNMILALRIALFPGNLQNIALIKLFGVPPVFVLKFFGEVILIFMVSAFINLILRIGRASEK